jgi:hypothetical protein
MSEDIESAQKNSLSGPAENFREEAAEMTDEDQMKKSQLS